MTSLTPSIMAVQEELDALEGNECHGAKGRVHPGLLSMAALCRSFGIRRQTGYKWVSRFTEDGGEGDFRALEERPRRPFWNPRQVDREIEDVVIRARKRHPTWGPRKLRHWLVEQFRGQRPHLVLPVASTMGEILKRHGLVRSRRRRRHTPPRTQPFSAVSAPNSVWCVDFKGHFRTKEARGVTRSR